MLLKGKLFNNTGETKKNCLLIALAIKNTGEQSKQISDKNLFTDLQQIPYFY